MGPRLQSLEPTPGTPQPRPEVAVAELDLAALAAEGPLRRRFLAIHGPDWIDLGIARWVDLLQPAGGWPVRVLGAFALTGGREQVDPAPSALIGAIIGVHGPEPIDRFDDLLECRSPNGARALDRPAGGRWHFIALSVASEARDGGAAQALLAASLQWVASQPGASACTLSPALGLRHALQAMNLGAEAWAAGCSRAALDADTAPFQSAVWRVLRQLGDAEGRPALPIFALHPKGGAWLEQVLFASRRDEHRSANVTLRFRYDLEPAARAAHRAAYAAWCARRAQRASAPGPLPGTRWWPVGRDDRAFASGSQGGSSVAAGDDNVEADDVFLFPSAPAQAAPGRATDLDG